MKKFPVLKYKLILAGFIVGVPVAVFSMSIDTINRYRCSDRCEESGYPYCVYRFDKHKLVDFNGRCYCVSSEERRQRGVLAEGIDLNSKIK